MGIVEEVGIDINNLQRGDRVVVPFTMLRKLGDSARRKWSACDNTNPNAHLMEAAYGYSSSGLFGYLHMMGGYAGGQAQYVRIPFANVGPLKIESDLSDEKVLFLSDIFRLATWLRKTLRFRKMTPSQYGVVGPLASSQSPALSLENELASVP